jgi:hypothetical protein
VESLVAAILLGMAGEDELGEDADPDPPDVEPRQAVDGLGSERGAVVGANDVGQAELAKSPLKEGLDELVLVDGRLMQERQYLEKPSTRVSG